MSKISHSSSSDDSLMEYLQSMERGLMGVRREYAPEKRVSVLADLTAAPHDDRPKKKKRQTGAVAMVPAVDQP
ncbi:hypothetical protein PG987_012430 [Apiospora arundinis]